MSTDHKEQRLPNSATQYEKKEGVLCQHSDCLNCRNTTVEQKKECNMYECPYHPFDIEDHWG